MRQVIDLLRDSRRSRFFFGALAQSSLGTGAAVRGAAAPRVRALPVAVGDRPRAARGRGPGDGARAGLRAPPPIAGRGAPASSSSDLIRGGRVHRHLPRGRLRADGPARAPGGHRDRAVHAGDARLAPERRPAGSASRPPRRSTGPSSTSASSRGPASRRCCSCSSTRTRSWRSTARRFVDLGRPGRAAPVRAIPAGERTRRENAPSLLRRGARGAAWRTVGCAASVSCCVASAAVLFLGAMFNVAELPFANEELDGGETRLRRARRGLRARLHRRIAERARRAASPRCSSALPAGPLPDRRRRACQLAPRP